MSEQNNGGPAFPNKAEQCNFGYELSGGMTLRDYFAAHAPPVPHDWRGGAKGFSSVIDWHWYFADQMLKARG